MFLRVLTIFLTVIFLSQHGLADPHSVNNIFGGSSQITSKSMRVKKEGFNKERIIIFKGDVRLENRKKTLTLYPDKMLFGFDENNQLKYFQMLGNVRMEKGKVHVSSQKAYSNNSKFYVDFFGDVTFSTNGSPIHVDKIRYSFASDTFSMPD